MRQALACAVEVRDEMGQVQFGLQTIYFMLWVSALPPCCNTGVQHIKLYMYVLHM